MADICGKNAAELSVAGCAPPPVAQAAAATAAAAAAVAADARFSVLRVPPSSSSRLKRSPSSANALSMAAASAESSSSSTAIASICERADARFISSANLTFSRLGTRPNRTAKNKKVRANADVFELAISYCFFGHIFNFGSLFCFGILRGVYTE